MPITHRITVPITFLDHRAACEWVRIHHTKYLDRVHSCPHNTQHRTYTSVDSFCTHLLDWTPEEKRELRKRILKLIRVCWSWKSMLVAAPEWKLILSSDQLEDGMPHTIHTAIVLPRWLVRIILFEVQDKSVKRTAYETLLHERIHTLQKAYPNKFKALYKQWGWRPIVLGSPIHRVLRQFEKSDRPTRHNPDTLLHWACIRTSSTIDTTTTWVPYVRIGSNGLRDVTYYLVTITNSSVKNTNTYSRQIRWYRMEDVDWYIEYFGKTDHCYHLDETSAVLLSEAIVNDTESNPIRKCPAMDVILKWCNTHWDHPETV